RAAARPALLDLAAAGEAVGDDERVRGGLPDLRQEHSLPARHRDVVVAVLVAPAAGHAAAARVELLDLDAEPLEQLPLGLRPAGRLVVAVPVQKRLPVEARRLPALGLGRHELREVMGLLAQAACVL